MSQAAAGDVSQQVALTCAAGVSSHAIAYPLSTVKVRLQVQGCGGGGHGALAYRGVVHALWRVARAEGPHALYRGLGAELAVVLPGGCLQAAACALDGALRGQSCSDSPSSAAGICFGICSSPFLVPAEVVSQRLQVQGQVKGGAQLYSGSLHAFRHIMQHEGRGGLYRAFLVHQLTWVPFHGCYFALYGKCKEWCINAGYEDGYDNLEPTAQVCCWSAAGMISGLLTNPIDVLRVRLQVARTHPGMFNFGSGLEAARHLLRHEGIAALMDGAVARAMWLTQRLVVYGCLYEELRAWLC